MKFNQFGKKLILMTAVFGGLFLASSLDAFAQFTFNGDYDRTFGAPNGYVIDPAIPNPGGGACSDNNFTECTYFVGGIYNPNGKTIALGRISGGSVDDFYLKKFTPSDALDTSFGGGSGFVKTNFFTDAPNNLNSGDTPYVIKRQLDGKIVVAGSCGVPFSVPFNGGYGRDVCAVRYNADGSLDSSFGNVAVPFQFCNAGGQCASNNFSSGAGKTFIQTGLHPNNSFYGSEGYAYDMAIQPDGKIILVGESRPNINGIQYVGILLRLNANGSPDTSFGTNGIANF